MKKVLDEIKKELNVESCDPMKTPNCTLLRPFFPLLNVAILEDNGMKIMKAKELKNRTGEALRLVKQGEKVMITVHGKPRAILSPADNIHLPKEQTNPEESWKEIEEALKRSKPPFRYWKEAMNWSRRRR